MTTRDWARQLREQQDESLRREGEKEAAIRNGQDALWDEIRQELATGIEGYGKPRHGRFEGPARPNHVWFVKLIHDTPNHNTYVSGMKVVHETATREIRISFEGVKNPPEMVGQIGILASGDIGLLVQEREILIQEFARMALGLFLSRV